MSKVSEKLNFLIEHGATKKEAIQIVLGELQKANDVLLIDNRLLLEGQGRQEIEFGRTLAENKRLKKLLHLTESIVDEAY